MQKPITFWDQVRACRAMLDIHHPGVFSLEKPVPLACGIRFEIAEAYPQIPGAVVRKLLWWLTQRRAYLSACTGGALRMGLAGPSGEVTPQQAAFSRNLFRKRDAAARDKFEAAA